MPLLRLLPISALVVLSLAPALAGAQGRATPAREKEEPRTRPIATDTSVSIPLSMVPPAGKCRIWMRDVPPAQQPAPTDCTTALRQAPRNGVLVFGPAVRDLSPFDVRNTTGPTSLDPRRARSLGRTDSAGSRSPDRRPVTGEADTRRQAEARSRAETRSKAGTTREAPPRTAPTSREAPPPRKPDPPPPTKKPE